MNSKLGTSLCLLFILLLSLGHEISAAKILVLLPVASKSHKNVFDPLIRSMGENKHEILVISPVKSSNMPPSVKDLVILEVDDLMDHMPDPIENRKSSIFVRMFQDMEWINKACHKVFEDERMQNVIKNEHFDLIIFDALGNDCFYGLMPHFRSIAVMMTTLPAANFMSEDIGQHFPPSFIPLPFLDYTDRMTFMERVGNYLSQIILPRIFQTMYISKWEDIYRQHLGQHLPSVHEIRNNLSMILMNSHFSLNYPRPLMSDVVEVGGMHCGPSKTLPTDLKKFIDEAEHGVIFFSLGSIVQGNKMPDEYRQVFLNVFSKLKQRVLWKWETEQMEGLPNNVKLIKWAPQQDILGHPNVKVFMTHGGLLSIQETVYHGVPLVVIPMFGDQDLNANQVERAGFAKKLEIIGMTEEILDTTIQEILSNSSYSTRVNELSKIFRDQPQTPLARATYWMEYLLRHKGGMHLRSGARELNKLQYHSVDVIAFLTAVLGVVIFTLRFLLKLVFRLFCCWFFCRNKESSEKANQTTKSAKKKQ